MMSFAMTFSFLCMMVVLEEEVFKATVSRKRDRCDTEAGKAALEPIESREWSRVSPCFPNIAVSARY